MSTPTTEIVSEASKAVEATGGIGMLGINLKIFIAQLINFLVVLFVLWKWVYQPIVKLLDERSARIEKSMQQAKEIESRFESTRIEQEALLTQAKTESSAILERARLEAETQKEKLTTKAKEEVQKVIIQGKEQLRLEKVAMIREAKKEIIEIAIAAVQKILEESVDEKKSQKLAQAVVEKMS